MKKRFKLKKVFFLVAAFAAVLFLLWGGYALLKALLVVPEVTVPDLFDLSYEEAEIKLEELGLGLEIVGEAYDEIILPDHIISQDPPAERNVRKERVIGVTISLGPNSADIPDLTGRSELEARLMLRDAGLEMEVSNEYSESVSPGLVIRQDPGKDFRLTKGETVHVIISRGKKPFSLRSFEGWSLEDAQEWVTLYGLVLRNLGEESSSDVPEGHIISQFPPAGEMVQSGDPVDLTISKGHDPGLLETFTIQIHPQVPIGRIIKVVLEDEIGDSTVFEGVFQGQTIDVRGNGSGYVTLMELRDGEYFVIDTRKFPRDSD